MAIGGSRLDKRGLEGWMTRWGVKSWGTFSQLTTEATPVASPSAAPCALLLPAQG